MNTNPDTVQAAIFYAKFTDTNLSEYSWACDIIQREINDVDRDQVSPQLAAAARILADEVERLRKELNTQSKYDETVEARIQETNWNAAMHEHENISLRARLDETRILADEVERLRAGQQQQSIAFSDCCEARAVVAGKPNSTQWYVCPQCCQPCDVFIRTTIQQPQ